MGITLDDMLLAWSLKRSDASCVYKVRVRQYRSNDECGNSLVSVRRWRELPDGSFGVLSTGVCYRRQREGCLSSCA